MVDNFGDKYQDTDVYGRAWREVYGGYFIKTDVLRAMVDPVIGIVQQVHPDMIVDLGGGTGLLLEALIADPRLPAEMKLTNVDMSSEQLAACSNERIVNIHARIDELPSEPFATSAGRRLWMMRAVLHYFGREGFVPVLERLRSYQQQGEYFIHQTVSSDSARHMECMNQLFAPTEKWFPTEQEMITAAEQSGWQVERVLPAPTLPIWRKAIARRYEIADQVMDKIARSLREHYGSVEGMIKFTEGLDFKIDLPFLIYVCRAV